MSIFTKIGSIIAKPQVKAVEKYVEKKAGADVARQAFDTPMAGLGGKTFEAKATKTLSNAAGVGIVVSSVYGGLAAAAPAITGAAATKGAAAATTAGGILKAVPKPDKPVEFSPATPQQIPAGSPPIAPKIQAPADVPKPNTQPMNEVIKQTLNAAAQIPTGLNISQAKVLPSGQMSVPTAQAGSGIFGQLINVGAQALTQVLKGKASPQVQTPVGSSIGNSVSLPIPGNGGVVSYEPPKNQPVTDNTTYTTSKGSFEISSILEWVILIGVVLFAAFNWRKIIGGK